MWVLIPAKRSTRAKSRLAPILSEEARGVLARLLLARLLTLITTIEQVEGAVLISDDAGLRAIAHLFGYDALPDPDAELNAALEAGRRHAMARGAESVLVLPTDLPWLTREVLERLLRETEQEGERVVLAPDHHGSGTNALFLRPAAAIPFSFGAGSGGRHRMLAEQAGIPLAIFSHPAIAYDLDLPEDWRRLVA